MLLSLPEDCLEHILEYLSTQLICKIATVCKTIYKISNNESLWEKLCFRDEKNFIDIQLRSKTQQYDTSWKMYYQQFCSKHL